MTANAEATGAREALLQLVNEFTDGTSGDLLTLPMRERMVAYINREYPAPAPRRVRAEIALGAKARALLWGKTRVQFIDDDTGSGCMVPTEKIGELAALIERADDEGCVEEENATLTDTLTDLRKIWTPTQEDFDAVCAEHEEGRDTPSASPEADGGSFTFTVSTPPVKRAVLLDGEQWVPKSELARVQREQDAARERARESEREWERWRGEALSLHAQLAAANNRVDVAYQQRNAALDRARVAEQRIEAGRECWLDREGNVWNAIEQGVDANANILAREKYGPFTRGRFVADTEDKA